MVVVKTIKDFAQHNEEDLKRFMRYKTGIYDENVINDHIQEFYVKLIETRALETFNMEEAAAKTVEAAFKHYIMNQLCWLMPIRAKKNFRQKYRLVSRVKRSKKSYIDDCDVWDIMGDHNKEFRVDSRYRASHVALSDDETVERDLGQFIEYIKRTEPEKTARKMVTFVEHRSYGCKSVEIADMLGVSSNMVTYIKRDVRRKFDEWRRSSFCN